MRRNPNAAALAVSEPAAPVAVVEDPEAETSLDRSTEFVPPGFEDLYETDFVLPRYAVVQPTSAAGRPGTFRSNLTGDEREELVLVPLRIQRGRVLWPTELGADPLCRSEDGLAPSSLVAAPRHEVCCVVESRRLRPVCPLAQWHPRGDGRSEPPTCRETHTLIALDVETESPFVLGFHRTAIRAVRVMRTVIFQRRLAIYDAVVRLRLRRENNGKGNFFVPEVAGVEPVTPKGKYRAMFDRFAGYSAEFTPEVDNGVTGGGKEEETF